jgi:hypothetical protein
MNLRGGDYFFQPPAVGRAASMYSMNRSTCPLPEVRGHRQDRLLVHPAPDHHVHFHQRQPGISGGGDGLQHPPGREVGVVERHEHRVVERVQADRNPAQARRGQRRGFAGQQRPIGGQRDVSTPSIEASIATRC